MNRVLENLDQWRLRVAWLELQLLCQQLTTSGGTSSADMNHFLEAVARAVLDVFELSTPIVVKEEPDQSGNNSSLKKRNESTGSSSNTPANNIPLAKACPGISISLIAPLVSKLTGAVQGRILKVASQVKLSV